MKHVTVHFPSSKLAVLSVLDEFPKGRQGALNNREVKIDSVWWVHVGEADSDEAAAELVERYSKMQGFKGPAIGAEIPIEPRGSRAEWRWKNLCETEVRHCEAAFPGWEACSTGGGFVALTKDVGESRYFLCRTIDDSILPGALDSLALSATIDGEDVSLSVSCKRNELDELIAQHQASLASSQSPVP